MKKQYVIKDFAETRPTGFNVSGLPFYYGGKAGVTAWTNSPTEAHRFEHLFEAEKEIERIVREDLERKKDGTSGVYEIATVYCHGEPAKEYVAAGSPHRNFELHKKQ